MNDTNKAKVQAWAQEWLRLSNAVLIDTETTGFGPGAEIISIAVISPAGEVLLDQFIKPQMPIPAEATDIHGLRDSDLKNAPTWKEVYPIVGNLLTAAHVVAYNADFDSKMIRYSNERHALPPIEWHSFDCAMLQYARFEGTWNRKRGQYKWHKLITACLQMGFEPPDTHSAIADANSALALVQLMADWKP